MVAPKTRVDKGQKGSFAEVLKNSPPFMEGNKEAHGKSGGKSLMMEEQAQETFHILNGVGSNSIGGSSGIGKDISLKDMYEALLVMKSNVDFLLNWVKLGLDSVGSEDDWGVPLPMGLKKDGLVLGLG